VVVGSIVACVVVIIDGKWVLAETKYQGIVMSRMLCQGYFDVISQADSHGKIS